MSHHKAESAEVGEHDVVDGGDGQEQGDGAGVGGKPLEERKPTEQGQKEIDQKCAEAAAEADEE